MPRGTAPGRRERALHDGVLLQNTVGTSAGVLAAFPEESLSPSQEGSRERAHSYRENRDSCKPHDRRCARGLPGDDSVQEFDPSYDREPGRGENNQATL